MSKPAKSVAIIGAGPTGLAAAAHAVGRGLETVVLEAGDSAGHAVRQWSHVRMFSPWTYNVDKASERLLRETGWNSPDPNQYPTGGELLEHYLEPLATRTRITEHIQTNSRVISIARAGFDKVKTVGRENAPFEIRYRNGKGPSTVRADAVIDASGTWGIPNPAGVNGLDAIGETEHAQQIAYGMPDVSRAERARYAGKTVAVLGAGHSAVGTILDLARLKQAEPQTQIVWLLRGDNPEKSFGGGANDKLAARGELGKVFAELVQGGGVRRSRVPAHAYWRQRGEAETWLWVPLLRRARRSRRACRGDRVPSGSVVSAGAAHLARPRPGVPTYPSASHRSQPAQLRDGAPAWGARAGATRAWFLLRRHEVLRPCADVPDDDRLRTGALDHCRHRR
jgi:NADPH-dependent 2,4-dienoyl-CoA reductase/sulfur reductase-like enzyme